MRKILIILIGTVLLFNNKISAQLSIENLNVSQTKKFIKSSQRTANIDLTISLLEHLCSLSPQNDKAFFNLGLAYYNKREYSAASEKFLKSYELNKQKNVSALYFYSKMLKYNGQVAEAINNFTEFKKIGKRTKFYSQNRKEIESEIAGFNVDSVKNNVKIARIDNEINNAGAEFSPIILDENRFIYSAFNNEKNAFSLYEASKIDNKWTKSDNVIDALSNLGYSIGSGSFSKDSLRFYFTVCKENWQNKTICEIYVTSKSSEDWTSPIKLEKPVNLTNYTSKHPTVTTNSKNADVLYFASDRPYGYGGLDIWFTEYDIKNEMFAEPKNLGGKVNSKHDEITPFYDYNSHCLFFSSNGFQGLGGFDIFKTYGDKRKWSSSNNIGKPLNSGSDDFFYVLKNNAGYLISNRSDSATGKLETCCDDIFAFEYNIENKILLKGSVYSINPIKYDNESTFSENIKVQLYIKGDDDFYLADEQLANLKGEYSFLVEKDNDYKVMVSSNNKEEFLTVNANDIKAANTDTINLMAISIDYIPTEAFTINDVYYAYNDYQLTSEAKDTISKKLLAFLNNNKNISVEIASHTDNKGEDSYNIELSQKRAQSVVDFLVTNGIDATRLKAKGYGENFPLTANAFSDGTDNETGRSQNRRTEFRIISAETSLMVENK
ncbi:MAG: hypothetical protein A2046_06060 [Bacteroidetes bacterium GWA2_30_7]|nr:MAG: hypothetical protein A2046_06060 [Bacteroidetes bacterium GWA2_30_7]